MGIFLAVEHATLFSGGLKVMTDGRDHQQVSNLTSDIQGCMGHLLPLIICRKQVGELPPVCRSLHSCEDAAWRAQRCTNGVA